MAVCRQRSSHGSENFWFSCRRDSHPNPIQSQIQRYYASRFDQFTIARNEAEFGLSTLASLAERRLWKSHRDDGEEAFVPSNPAATTAPLKPHVNLPPTNLAERHQSWNAMLRKLRRPR